MVSLHNGLHFHSNSLTRAQRELGLSVDMDELIKTSEY